MESHLIGNIFKVQGGKRVRPGYFEDIYTCINTLNNEEVAIKLEHVKTKHPTLIYQSKLYQYLQRDTTAIDKGIPKIYFVEKSEEYNIMIMDLLGPSLEVLFMKCNKRFSLKTTLMLADQLISRVQFLHSKQFLHRDITPDSILIGKKQNASKLYMTNFGIAKRFTNKDGNHIEQEEGKSLTGTARYASLNTHLGIGQSRRDDLESLGYILVYFLKGGLPWMGIKATSKQVLYDKIRDVKQSVKIESLCGGLPQELSIFLNYTRNLRFDEKPDYQYLRKLFEGLFRSQKFEMDFIYDWVEQVPLQKPPQALSVVNASNSKDDQNRVCQPTKKEFLR